MEAVYSDLKGLTVSARVVEEDSGRPIHGDLESPPDDFDIMVTLISVDVEAFEFNQKLVTEIGISTLDIADLLGLQPGAKGNNWAAKIRSRHFRIREHSHRLNKVHVEGCPDKFDFGQSEWISKQDVVSALKGCFNPSRSPYSSGTCKAVLLGHDVAADMKYLKELGFDVARMISDCIDTSDLYRALRRDGRQSARPSRYLLLVEMQITAMREAFLRDDKAWTDMDIVFFHLFLVKLDMRLSDPILGNGMCELSHMLLTQKSLSLLYNVLTKKMVLDYDEATEMLVRTYLSEDLDTKHSWLEPK